MVKITSLEDFKKISRQLKETISARTGKAKTTVSVNISAAGAREALKALTSELEKAGIADVAILPGPCGSVDEPVFTVHTGAESVTYKKVTPDMARRIASEHIAGGKPFGK